MAVLSKFGKRRVVIRKQPDAIWRIPANQMTTSFGDIGVIAISRYLHRFLRYDVPLRIGTVASRRNACHAMAAPISRRTGCPFAIGLPTNVRAKSC